MNITILFGAKSFEHEISIISAITMKKVLQKYNLTFIFCDYNRDFYLIPNENMTSKRFSSGEYKKDKRVYLETGGFFTKGLMKSNKIPTDITLNLIHGMDGEDGKIASLLEFYDIKYIGPRVEASVISYNKLLTKIYAKEMGVNVLPYQVMYKNRPLSIDIAYPLIIKPARLGSSLGITIVKEKDELDYALDVAFEFDDTILVEPFIENIKEYNLAGYLADDFYFSIIEEPKKSEFLDFDKKYLDFSRSKKINEADICQDLKEKIRKKFIDIYDPLFRGSIIRCDFFVLEDAVYLNEINPVPGSMANYLFENFSKDIDKISKTLPKQLKVPNSYKYIHKIQSAKGK